MKAAVIHKSGFIKYDPVDDPKLSAKDHIITYILLSSEISHAYDIFKKREHGCVKVVLDPWK